MITWVSTSVISYVWQSIDPKILGVAVAMAVALTGYIVSDKRSIKKLAVVPFNGLLIYLTIIGGSSFLPAPGLKSSPVVTDTAETATSPSHNTPSHFFTQWNPNIPLIKQVDQLNTEKKQLETKNQHLVQMNSTYAARLESTRSIIKNYHLSPQVERQLLQNLTISTNLQPANN